MTVHSGWHRSCHLSRKVGVGGTGDRSPNGSILRTPGVPTSKDLPSSPRPSSAHQAKDLLGHVEDKFCQDLTGELPSLPHQFCSGLQTDLGFPKWIVGSVFDVYIQRIYCGKRAWSASKCNLSVFPSVVCLSIHLRQGNVRDIYCFAFWWREFLVYSLYLAVNGLCHGHSS